MFGLMDRFLNKAAAIRLSGDLRTGEHSYWSRLRAGTLTVTHNLQNQTTGYRISHEETANG